VQPARDSIRLTTHLGLGMVRLARGPGHANAKILFNYCEYCLRLHLRVLGDHYLLHATAEQHPMHESAAHSDPALIHNIPARVQLEVVAGVYEDHNRCPPLDFALIDSFDTCSVT
jgi:hypothetical protein